MNKMIRLKKVLGLLMAGIVICAGITACGNDSKSVSNTEVTGETENSSSEEVTEDTSLSIPGMWQTAFSKVSVDYLDDVKDQYPDYEDAAKFMGVNTSDAVKMVL